MYKNVTQIVLLLENLSAFCIKNVSQFVLLFVYSLLSLTNKIIRNVSVLQIHKLAAHTPTPKYTPNPPPPHRPAPTQSSQKILLTSKPILSKDLVTCIWVQIFFCFKSTHSMICASIGYQCILHWLPKCNNRSTFVTSITFL